MAKFLPFIKTPERTTSRMERLIAMLSYKRPHGSATEKEFINRFLFGYIQRDLKHPVCWDKFGNYYVHIGESDILWSSHIDTVHKKQGYQRLHINKTMITLDDKKDNNCLGADCTSGIFVMMEMIKAGVPGTYVFHRDEEHGGNGSKYIAKNRPIWLSTYKYAIAFDRHGTDSVITHQRSRRTCSDDFAKQLAESIDMKMKPDDGGTFTDTASYQEIVPECTNVSVGYYKQHSDDERQDVGHLMDLADKMCSINTAKWEPKRDPSKTEYKSYGNYGSYGGYKAIKACTSLYQLINHHPYLVERYLIDLGANLEDLKQFDERDRKPSAVIPYGMM